MTVIVEHETRGPGLLVRSLWFLFIGWWLAGFATAGAWIASVTIIGLPLGFWIFNRIPTVLTLRPRRTTTTITTGGDGTSHIIHSNHPQSAWWKRVLYFALVGWWLSAIWSVLAWLLCVLIVTLPFGVMMYNRLPAVTTLHRY